MMINPKAAKRFAEAMQPRTRPMPSMPWCCSVRPAHALFTPWQRPDDLAIRACARHIAALNQLRTQTKNQLHAAQQTTTTPDFLIASRHQSIAHFDAQIEYLRRQVLDLIRRMKRSGRVLQAARQRHRYRRRQCHPASR